MLRRGLLFFAGYGMKELGGSSLGRVRATRRATQDAFGRLFRAGSAGTAVEQRDERPPLVASCVFGAGKLY